MRSSDSSSAARPRRRDSGDGRFGETETGLAVGSAGVFRPIEVYWRGHEPPRTDHWTHYLPGFR